MTETSIKKLIDANNLDVNLERAKAIATIVITAVVNIANVCGYAMDAEPVVNGILSILSAISIIYTWWKNQNVTVEAAKAQLVLTALKEETKVAKHANKAA